MINFPKFQGHEKVTKKSGMSTGDPMILTLRVPPLATEQGLCDIERISFRVTQKNFKKKWEVLVWRVNRYFEFCHLTKNRRVRFSQFFIFFWATLSDNLSISYSPYSLASGGTRNVRIIESPLGMDLIEVESSYHYHI